MCPACATCRARNAVFLHSELAARGYDIILVARRKQLLDELAQELKNQHGIQVDVLVADLATEQGMTSVEERIKQTENLTMLSNANSITSLCAR